MTIRSDVLYDAEGRVVIFIILIDIKFRRQRVL